MNQLTAPSSTQQQIVSTLNQLGPTADEVADRIRALGIKGRRHSPERCPIANLLTSIPGVMIAEVLEADVEIFVSEDEGTDVIEIPVPDAVSDFIVQFDRGVHLDLVDTAAVA
jgi:hypothetical protein